MDITTQNDITTAINNISQPKVLLDEKFQKKLIKVLIEDSAFSEEVTEMLLPEYFDGLLSNTLMNYILSYFKKYNLIPDFDTLIDIVNDKEKDSKLKKHLLEFISLIKDLKLTDKQHVKDYTSDFCKKQSLRKGLLTAAESWERGNYEEIHKIISDALKAGQSKVLGLNFFNELDKILIKEVRNPVPFLDGFDSHIAGGLAGGELGVILSPTGGGKSMVLVKGSCTALMNGKTVVYYSLELSEKVIGHRFASCLCGVRIGEIMQMTDVIKEKMSEIKELGGQLVIKEFPTASATVNTIRAHIKSLEHQRILPDIIFVDYADILKPVSSFNEKRFALTSIYEGLRALSMELGVPIWTASQASRASINESKFDLRVISESLGKAQTADIILGLGRSDDDKALNKAQFMVLKNRNGRDGFNIELHFDTTNINIFVKSEDSNIGYGGLREAITPIEKRINENLNKTPIPPPTPYTQSSDSIENMENIEWDDET